MHTYTEFRPQVVYLAIYNELKKSIPVQKYYVCLQKKTGLFEKLLESSTTLLAGTQDGLYCSDVNSMKCNPMLNVNNCLHLIHYRKEGLTQATCAKVIFSIVMFVNIQGCLEAKYFGLFWRQIKRQKIVHVLD